MVPTCSMSDSLILIVLIYILHACSIYTINSYTLLYIIIANLNVYNNRITIYYASCILYNYNIILALMLLALMLLVYNEIIISFMHASY